MEEKNVAQNPPQAQQPIQPVENKIQVSKPASKSKLPMILIIIFVLLVILGSGIYYFAAKSIKNNTPVTPPTAVPDVRPSPTIEETASSDPTSNWKTYSDTQLGISFRYPSNGKINKLTEGTSSLYITDNSNNIPHYLFNIDIKDNKQNLTARQVIENEIQMLRNDKNVPGGGAQALADYRESTIKDYRNGVIDGFSMRWGKDGDAVNNAIEIVSIKSNKIYNFTIHDGNGSVDEFHKNLIDQILSTFKFTNQ